MCIPKGESEETKFIKLFCMKFWVDFGFSSVTKNLLIIEHHNYDWKIQLWDRFFLEKYVVLPCFFRRKK